MKKRLKGAAVAVCALIICILTVCGYAAGDVARVRKLPAELTATSFRAVDIGAAKGYLRNGKLIFKLFGIFPVKTIEIRESGEEVYIGGTPIGLSMEVMGVIVEDIGTVSTGAGEVAARTTLKKGDIILEVNSRKVSNNTELRNITFFVRPRETAIFKVKRGAETVTLEVLAERMGNDIVHAAEANLSPSKNGKNPKDETKDAETKKN